MDLTQDGNTYSMTIEAEELEDISNQGTIEIKVRADAVNDISQNAGPSQDQVFSFINDIDGPAMSEFVPVINPTNEDRPLITIRSRDVISSGVDQIKVTAYLGAIDPDNQIFLAEGPDFDAVAQVQIDGSNEISQLHIVGAAGGNPVDLPTGSSFDGRLYDFEVCIEDNRIDNQTELDLSLIHI